MKKTLFVLGFAMLATVSMAQTKKAVLTDVNPVKVHPSMSDFDKPVDYKASIFTKDDDVAVRTFQFASDDMTGIVYGASGRVLAGDVIDGASVAAADAHGVDGTNTYWTRINSTDSIPEIQGGQPVGGGVGFATSYPMGIYYGAAQNRMGVYMGEQNGIEEDNGFMFVSLIEHMSDANDYHVFFSLPAVTLPEGAGVVDVDFRQYFRKFYDNCYIDYKLNNAWFSVEVNVDGVDVEVNGTAPGHMRVTMPLSVATSGSAELRFRVHAPGGYATHGYMWAVDNVSIVVAGDDVRWTFNTPAYLNGFYGTLPQGFNIPVSYLVNARNTAVTDITGVHLTLDHIYNNVSTTVIDTVQDNLPYGDVFADNVLRFNESGFMHPTAAFRSGVTVDGVAEPYAHSWPEYYTAYDVDETALEGLGFSHRGLPTQNAGLNTFAIGAYNAQGLTAALDSMNYTVSDFKDGNDANSIIAGYRWANDNGLVPGGSEFGWQYEGPYVGNMNPYDDSSIYNHHYMSGYFTMTRFNSPSSIPTDEDGNPWVFRGMELVTSTHLTSDQVTGARISPVVYSLLADDTGAVNFYWFSGTGFSGNEIYEVPSTAAPEDIEDNYGYLLPDVTPYAYDILFPGQPEIRPNATYFFGYSIAEQSTYAVAQTQYYFKDETGNTAYYNNPETAPYYKQFTPANKIYDVYTYDPVGSSLDNTRHTIVGWNIDCYPMIRAIVGPKLDIPSYDVYLECPEEEGQYWVYSNGYNYCGVHDTLIEGQWGNYILFPGSTDEFEEWQGIEEDDYFTIDEDVEGGYGHMVIDALYDNGNAIDLTDTNKVDIEPFYVYWAGHTPADGPDNEWAPATSRNFYRYYVRDIHEDHVISAHASYQPLAIGEVEDYINLSLAPNPATSQVAVRVAGFSGKANCSILDMSGRVVYSTDITAGESIINLSNVPAGAYFVRVTNNVFSKVEKLIVR